MIVKQWKDVVSIISGKNQKDVVNPNGKYPIYGSGGIIGYADSYLCNAGTTIVGRKGTINNPIFVEEPFWNIDTAFGVVPGDQLIPKYLYYFCLHFSFKPLDKSTGRPSLAKSDLLKIEMPVPDLGRQEQIVSQIEESLFQLDSAVETLKKTKQQLEVYRQAVLRDAFNNVSLDDYNCLKSVIVGMPQNGLYKPKSDYGTGTCILRIDGFYDGRILDDYDYKRVKLDANELEKYCLQINDLVINRVNSMQYLGKCALVRTLAENTIFESNMMRIKLNPSLVDYEYIIYYLSSVQGRKELTKNAKQAVNQASINQTDVCNTILPLPDVSVQRELRKSIDKALFVYEDIGSTIHQSLQKADALRQSILKQAFSLLGRRKNDLFY